MYIVPGSGGFVKTFYALFGRGFSSFELFFTFLADGDFLQFRLLRLFENISIIGDIHA